MKIKYLGTAAAERVPAIFCNCPICNSAREKKGKDIRTQTQTLLDDGDLLIDFPGDSYLHMLKYELNYNDIENLLVTHWHSDHFYGEDVSLRMEGYARNLSKKLNVYGSLYVKGFFDRAFELEQRTDPASVEYHVLEPYKEYTIGHYTVFPVPAQHGLFQGDCFIYVIKDIASGKTLFYTHDTGLPKDEVLDAITQQGFVFDVVSLDCTSQSLKGSEAGPHMAFDQNLTLIEKMKQKNLVHEKTKYIANHFSHNGGLDYEGMSALSESHGVLTAYDGMVVEV